MANAPPPEVERVRELVRAEGRDPESFGIDARVDVGQGTPEEWRAAVETWRKAGASHVTLVTMGGGLAGPDAHAGRLEEALAALR